MELLDRDKVIKEQECILGYNQYDESDCIRALFTNMVNIDNIHMHTKNIYLAALNINAFNLYRERNNQWNFYNRPTKVLYDPIMYVFSQNLDSKDLLIEKKDDIRKGIAEFYKKEYKSFGGRNTGKSHVEDRIKKMEDFINSFISEA